MRVNHSSGKQNYKKVMVSKNKSIHKKKNNTNHFSLKHHTVMVNYILNHNINHSSDKLRTVMTNYMANKWPS